jgi:hypothetical protein
MPWGRLDDSLYDHPKLDALPADRRLEAIGLWARAISWCNRFLTDGNVPRDRVVKLDGTLELADLLVAAGLFERTATGYAIHDFLRFNDSRTQIEERRHREAERKAAWRAGKRPGGTDDGTLSTNYDDVPLHVPPSVPVGHSEMSRAESRRLSRDSPRARDRARHDANPDPSRPVPSHESLDRDSARGRAQRSDVQALRDRGYRRVTKAQRRVLDEILARHDQTGAEFAASAIRSAAPGVDPLRAAMDADALWQAARRRQADADESAWQQTKDDDRAVAANVPWLDPVKVEA